MLAKQLKDSVVPCLTHTLLIDTLSGQAVGLNRSFSLHVVRLVGIHEVVKLSNEFLFELIIFCRCAGTMDSAKSA